MAAVRRNRPGRAACADRGRGRHEQGSGTAAGITEIDAARRALDEAAAERAASLAVLQRSRAQLAALVAQAPHGIAMLDRELNYLAASEHWVRQYGQGQALAGLNHLALLPDLPEACRDAHRRALAGDTVRAEAQRWPRADGHVQWISWVIQPWTDDDGAIGGLVVSFDDVTRQQQALDELREAHERFATLFDHAPVAMVVGDLTEGRITQVNQAFQSLTGYAPAEVTGRTSLEFELWPDAALRPASHERLRELGLVPSTETRLRRKAGELIDVSFSACRVQIGGAQHFIAMIVDISPQVEARRALQRQQEALESQVAQRTAELAAANATLAERAAAITDLYDRAPCGYHELTPEGVIASANATELAMLGYARDEFVGQPLVRFMTPHSVTLFRER